ncbi:MAG: hypothetical protein CMH94_02955 [Oceanicaulis sp.]|nr:hypothetical protein [Maricaulis sp.]MBI74541.1 hypothetical protein [Oceanicaulis sp.]|tara:strand:+ start:1038 stop:1412 length:375 start_codon:yes stop_codon:yes gene_type:complete
MSIATLNGILAAALAAAVQTGVEPSDVSIRIIGSGTLECTFQTADGEVRRQQRARRSGSFETVRASDALSGQCTYNVPENRDLHVRIMEAGQFACPFEPGIAPEECSVTINGEASGTFDLAQAG